MFEGFEMTNDIIGSRETLVMMEEDLLFPSFVQRSYESEVSDALFGDGTQHSSNEMYGLVDTRIHKAMPVSFQEMSSMKKCEKKKAKRRSSNRILLDDVNFWLFAHQDNPYPSLETKEYFCKKYNLTAEQIKTTFTNQRKRFLHRTGVGHRDFKCVVSIPTLENGDLLFRNVKVHDKICKKPTKSRKNK